ncbi:hypothetical protein ACOMHN_023575 [Nucella lapillus]
MEGDHPSYTEMITTAVTTLVEHGGSSPQTILKFILAKYKMGTDHDEVYRLLKIALRAGVQSEALRRTRRGLFRLGERTPMRAKKPESEGDEPTEPLRVFRPLTGSCFSTPTKNDMAKKAPKPPAKKATKPLTKTAVAARKPARN